MATALRRCGWTGRCRVGQGTRWSWFQRVPVMGSPLSYKYKEVDREMGGWPAGDALHRPLVPRFRFRVRLSLSV